MFHFDPMYFIFVGPAMLLAMWAQFKVRSAYSSAKKLANSSRVSGAEAARGILTAQGLSRVRVEQTPGELSDHYDPKTKVLRLSPDVYSGRSIAALGIAAHEAGHAVQDAENYGPLVLRNGIVPLASIGSNASFFLIMLGMLLSSSSLLLLGIGAFSLVVVFQLINLPVEFDASARARQLLLASGMVSTTEDREVKKVLNAAALTYVAATVTAILTLLYYLWRSGLLSGRRD